MFGLFKNNYYRFLLRLLFLLVFMKIACLNTRGLNDQNKQRKFVAICNIEKYDVIFVQETHIVSVAKAEAFEKLWGGKVYWRFGKYNSCGVAIMFKPAFQFTFIDKIADVDGRLLAINIERNKEVFTLISLYAPCKWEERLEFMHNLSASVKTKHYTIMAGDVNCIDNPALDYKGPATSFTVSMKGSVLLRDLCDELKLVDVYRLKYPSTPAFTWNARQTFSRIDRIFVSKSLYSCVFNAAIKPVSFSDHSWLEVDMADNKTKITGPGFWKCNVSILQDPDLVEDIKTHSVLALRKPLKDATWWEELKSSFQQTVRLHSVRLANIRKNKIHDIQKRISQATNLPNPDTVSIAALKDELNDYLTYILKGDAIRAKIECLKDELNPSFGTRMEKTQGTHKVMSTLVTSHGVLTDTPAIIKETTQFYADLFTAEPVDQSFVNYFLHDVKRLTDELKFTCDGPITYHECIKAISAMKNGKSPGMDGLPKEFYHQFFSFFGAGYVEMLNNCYTGGLMSASMRRGAITLLCKDVTKADQINSWRPITLLNIDYKIMSKVLSNRLKVVLHANIHPDQTCSVPGRSIIDNLHLLRGITDYTGTKNIPAALISLDQAKAFDRVSHDYLFQVLHAFGFGQSFIDWIRLCYAGCSSQLIINGFLTDRFNITRSIRQGCSLSAMLYVLCIEPFAHWVRTDRHIVGLSLP